MTAMERYLAEKLICDILRDGAEVESRHIKAIMAEKGLPEGCYRSARQSMGCITRVEGKSAHPSGKGRLHFIRLPPSGPKRNPMPPGSNYKPRSRKQSSNRSARIAQLNLQNDSELLKLRKALRDKIAEVDTFLGKLHTEGRKCVHSPHTVQTATLSGHPDGGVGYEV